ncbi:hypothetical protein NE237_028070 [Protea cynaroides]|uniref:Uncharacterized protein n=1 Tax=Protea cynaroides TaxID=273540 RepID=A0A9Q0GP71_9MAGN|nr:hypothetical protein NE237_028070 [Protea cynaroides]
MGDLYELDRNSKPSWKKHIWGKGFKQEISLIPSTGCIIHGLIGTHSISLFLLTKSLPCLPNLTSYESSNALRSLRLGKYTEVWSYGSKIILCWDRLKLLLSWISNITL